MTEEKEKKKKKNERVCSFVDLICSCLFHFDHFIKYSDWPLLKELRHHHHLLHFHHLVQQVVSKFIQLWDYLIVEKMKKLKK
jgi:hypothetical protein